MVYFIQSTRLSLLLPLGIALAKSTLQTGICAQAAGCNAAYYEGTVLSIRFTLRCLGLQRAASTRVTYSRISGAWVSGLCLVLKSSVVRFVPPRSGAHQADFLPVCDRRLLTV